MTQPVQKIATIAVISILAIFLITALSMGSIFGSVCFLLAIVLCARKSRNWIKEKTKKNFSRSTVIAAIAGLCFVGSIATALAAPDTTEQSNINTDLQETEQVVADQEQNAVNESRSEDEQVISNQVEEETTSEDSVFPETTQTQPEKTTIAEVAEGEPTPTSEEAVNTETIEKVEPAEEVKTTPVTTGIIKKSESGLCHAPGTTYYEKTKTFIRYNSIEECLASGGSLPKR